MNELYIKLKEEADIQLANSNYNWKPPKINNSVIERLIMIYYHNSIPSNIESFNILELDVPYTQAMKVINQAEWDYLKLISLFDYRVR